MRQLASSFVLYDVQLEGHLIKAQALPRIESGRTCGGLKPFIDLQGNLSSETRINPDYRNDAPSIYEFLVQLSCNFEVHDY
jgi:hypothetical protein